MFVCIMATHRSTVVSFNKSLLSTVWWAQQFRVLQGVVGAAKTLFAMALLGVTEPLAAVAVGLVSFGVYIGNDLADVEEDQINCPDGSAVLATSPLVVATLAVTTITLGVGIGGWAGGLTASLAVLVLLGVTLPYSLPVTPAGRRMKDVFIWNSVLMAAGWAVTVTAVPLALADRAVEPLALAVCLLLFLRTFASIEIFNLPDIEGDAATGINTLPVVLGVDWTRRLLAVVDLASISLLVALLTVPVATVPALLALPVVGISFLLTLFIGRTDRVDELCLAKDGEYLLLGVIALFVLGV